MYSFPCTIHMTMYEVRMFVIPHTVSHLRRCKLCGVVESPDKWLLFIMIM